jgi:hypothetical protein
MEVDDDEYLRSMEQRLGMQPGSSGSGPGGSGRGAAPQQHSNMAASSSEQPETKCSRHGEKAGNFKKGTGGNG